MCKCTPAIRTPFCGKLGCEWPNKKPEGARPSTPARTAAESAEDVAKAFSDERIADYERIFGLSDDVRLFIERMRQKPVTEPMPLVKRSTHG